jgi:hypothetical protein
LTFSFIVYLHIFHLIISWWHVGTFIWLTISWIINHCDLSS